MVIGNTANGVNSWLATLKSITSITRVDEVECGEGGTTWVGAHPSLGNKVTNGQGYLFAVRSKM